eukprot:m.15306 g.15306  ORF g.15306 m.15306 type:complete len:56 (-) comp4988_c1_seq1:97-264(-)
MTASAHCNTQPNNQQPNPAYIVVQSFLCDHHPPTLPVKLDSTALQDVFVSCQSTG